MVAPWDRRTAAEQSRLEAATLARWLPAVVTAAPFHAARTGAIDDRLLTDRRGLQRLVPARERDLLADGAAGATAVLRPTEEQVKASADDRVITGIARAIRRDAEHGKRDAIVHEYRPLQLHRGGVDGELLIASTRSDLDRSHRTGARAASVLGLGEDDVIVSAVAAGPTLAHLGTVHLATGAGLTALHARGAGADLAAVAKATTDLAATVLVVATEEAVELADTLRRARAKLRDLRTVVAYGPPLTAEERGAILEAFTGAGASSDLRVRALWAPDVGRAPWAECAEGGGGLHTYPDLEVLEVLDPLTGRVTDGDGDLTVTSLGWHGTAHVRFQTGTWVDPLATDPCPGCSRTVPRITGDVAPHAWELTVDLDGGERGTIDLRGIAAVVAGLDGIEAWRAELRGPDERVPRDRLLIELAGGADPGEAAGLERRFEAATGLVPELTVGVHPDEVARSIDEVGGVLADRR
ncbi:MAG: hypothetical protein WEB09_09320 [Nitriliruptor sp.]